MSKNEANYSKKMAAHYAGETVQLKPTEFVRLLLDNQALTYDWLAEKCNYARGGDIFNNWNLSPALRGKVAYLTDTSPAFWAASHFTPEMAQDLKFDLDRHARDIFEPRGGSHAARLARQAAGTAEALTDGRV